MKRSVKTILALSLAAFIMLPLTISVSADEPVVYYFVDCGDYTPDTVSEGDAFGLYNSVTDQYFGADPSTGRQWGIVDDAGLNTEVSYDDGRVTTMWTWPGAEGDGLNAPKENTYRFCHDMMENGLDRVLTYKFEMPEDGEYVVEVGFLNPWSVASPVDVYLNGELAVETLNVDNGTQPYGYATVSPKDGFITVEAKTVAATINMTYIIISNVLTNEETQPDETEPEYIPVTDGPEATEPETKAPEKPAETSGNAETPENDKKEDGGCGSVMSFGTIGVFAVSAAAAAFGKLKKNGKRK